MSRAYIRLDPGFDEHKYEYPDSAYSALVATLCLAELQPERGRFRSAEYLRRLLGKRGKSVGYLMEHKDLIELPDGRVYVEGWDHWQEGDWKVTERVQRIRARRGNGAANGGVTVDVTPPRLDSGAARSGAVTAEQSGADGRDDLEAFLLVTRRAPSAKQRRVLDDYLVIFDESGPKRAARIILSNPSDPIGAIMADLDEHRKARLAEVQEQESEAKRRRLKQRQKVTDPVGRELLEEWARQRGEQPAEVA